MPHHTPSFSHARLLVMAAIVAVTVAALGVPSGAQVDPSTTTTSIEPGPSSSTTSSTTAAPPSSTSTTAVPSPITPPAPAGSTTSTSQPPRSTTSTTQPESAGAEDAVSDEPPPAVVPVLPPPKGPPPNGRRLRKALARLTVTQRARIVEVRQAAAASATRLAEAEDRLAVLDEEGMTLRVGRVDAALRFAVARKLLQQRAISVYTGRKIGLLDVLLGAEDLKELSRRAAAIEGAMNADADAIRTYRSSRDELQLRDGQLAAAEAAQREHVEVLAAEDARLQEDLLALQAQLQFIRRGGIVALAGFVFPVQPPFSFIDTFGAPRMTGTVYEHRHQGTDIFALSGTPLRASVRGVIARMGTDTLGGTKLWLVGGDGTRYYYAHLSAFAPGLVQGQVVEAGDIVGFVGNTGNAKTTPAHLHFEIHPMITGDVAINPYPVLKAVETADLKAFKVATGQPSGSPSAQVAEPQRPRKSDGRETRGK